MASSASSVPLLALLPRCLDVPDLLNLYILLTSTRPCAGDARLRPSKQFYPCWRITELVQYLFRTHATQWRASLTF